MESPIYWKQKILESRILSESWKKALRPALKEDYAMWLREYLNRGGEVTHNFNKKFPISKFWTATDNITITPLYGSAFLFIIIRKDFQIWGDPGHNYIFEYEFSSKRIFVPNYSDLFD